MESLNPGPAGYFAGLNGALSSNVPMTTNAPQEFEHTAPLEAEIVEELPKRIPGATFSCDGPPNACGTCEVCQQVKQYEEIHDSGEPRELSDFEILNERVDELLRILNQHGQTLATHTNTLNYLGQSMNWLTNMLSGVAEIATKMPGMGGMMTKFLMPKGGK